MHSAAEQRRHAFSVWLRTGRWPRNLDSRQREFKFNPWHDTRNGRFTFPGAGRYFARGGANSPNAAPQDSPKIDLFIDDPAKPRLTSVEEIDAWAAKLLAEHGNKPGYAEAIEARRQRYKENLASRPSDPLGKVVEFAEGLGEGFYDVGKGVVTGFYSLVTTNPITSVQNIEFGIARMLDGAIAAEDTPAHVQITRAAASMANASAHDVGYALGSVAGNVGLAVVPGAITTKVSSSSRVGKVGAVAAPKRPPKIIWVDENIGLKGVAKNYNDSAMGARSNVATKRGRVPALERTMPDGTIRAVKFDGVDGDYLIDRKWSIYTTQKSKEQALRQSDALAQHGLTAIWEVPTQIQKNRAIKMLNQLNIPNITVRVIKS